MYFTFYKVGGNDFEKILTAYIKMTGNQAGICSNNVRTGVVLNETISAPES
jgi:hypothetical protein